MKDIQLSLNELSEKLKEIEEEERYFIDTESKHAEEIKKYPIEKQLQIKEERKQLMEQQQQIKRLLLQKKNVLVEHFNKLKELINKLDITDDDEEDDEEEDDEEEEEDNVEEDKQKTQPPVDKSAIQAFEIEKAKYLKLINQLINEKNLMKGDIQQLSSKCRDLETLYGAQMDNLLIDNKRLQQENEAMLVKLEQIMKDKEEKVSENENGEMTCILEQKKNLLQTLDNQDYQIENLQKQNSMLETQMAQIVEQAQYQQKLNDTILLEKDTILNNLVSNLKSGSINQEKVSIEKKGNINKGKLLKLIEDEIPIMEALLVKKRPQGFFPKQEINRTSIGTK